MTATDMETDIDSQRFRSVLGHFCTGVTVVSADDGEHLAGLACQSFAALSLTPPLVLFCPTKTSGSWQVIERAGRFAVNVLAADQDDVSTVFGSRGTDKFASVDWHYSPGGSPLLDGALTWIDCTLETTHEAGDHYVVIGRVHALGETRDTRPLLFYQGSYSVTERSQEEPAPIRSDLEGLLTWPRPDDWF